VLGERLVKPNEIKPSIEDGSWSRIRIFQGVSLPGIRSFPPIWKCGKK
jgi:hypothetical protein